MFVLTILFVSTVAANSLSRIVNGVDSTIEDHPHQISLEWTGQVGYHICGGSIVAPRWILTAAHCVPDGNATAQVVATNNGRLSSGRTEYKVLNVIVHPQYNTGKGAYPNDIALLELAEEINVFDNQHRVIKLADSSYGSFEGQNCVISGWGRLYGDGPLPDVLQETTGIILSNTNCIGRWGSNINGKIHICILDEVNESGSCNGDSGGPMVCNGVLAGVTSWGASGCIMSYPSVYTRVSNYYSWIIQYTGPQILTSK